jgi:DNA (cytosine-5)-methyltransferase 1
VISRGKKKRSGHSVDVVSFFCGCGGMDLGFQGGFTFKWRRPKTRFKIIAAYDNDASCVHTYRENLGGAYVQEVDLAQADIGKFPAADVLIGGFPCQAFSISGKRNGLKGEGGKLYLAMTRYLEKHAPKVVVGENVPGLRSLQSGRSLDTIVADVERAGPGYSVQVWKLYAPDLGIPQTRTRLFIVGVRRGLEGFPVEPKTTFRKERYRSIKWGIGDLERGANGDRNHSQYFKANRATNGSTQGDETSRANEPSYTIRANSHARIQYHYSLDRRLTVRECARLQTFPDSFHFPHSTTTNVMHIGNAVPPVMAHRVATTIERYLTHLKDVRR